MTSTIDTTRFDRGLRAVALALMLPLALPLAAAAQPTFSKAFSPDTIGPGSVSMLTFTIDNSASATGASDLAFSDTLPVGVTLAAPAFVSNTCVGTVTFIKGKINGITFSDGKVGAGATCTIVVNVTASAGDGESTTYTNISGTLTSSAGSSGTARDDLTVTTSRPGFSKSFAPSTVQFGGRSTLTFLINNSSSGSVAANLEFTDTLPPGMVVADPANASTTCGQPPGSTTLTATPGTSVVSLSSIGGPALGAESSCTVTVDVVGGAIGASGNVSGELLVTSAAGGQVSSGKAAAVLTVTGFDDLLSLEKEFTDDPVLPGGTTTLRLKVTNRSRTDSATDITFSDDLETTLTGLTPTLPGTPNPPCGAGSSLSFSAGKLELADGTLAPEASCIFSVSLSVPAGAAPGTYPNTAGPVSGTVGGSAETGNAASDLLFVVSFPVLTKEFTDDPVGAGGVVTLQFTITNTSTASKMTNVTFTDTFDSILQTSPSGAPAAGFCGAGSTATFTPAVFNNVPNEPASLRITGASLEKKGTAGDSCTFSITLGVVPGAAAGAYPNTTSQISAVLADAAGTPTVTGPPAKDDLLVVGAPRLSKVFTDDPVAPGGTVTLEFTLTHDTLASADATGIGFTDDLAALSPAVAGLTATLPPSPDPPCGAGSSLTGSAGDTLLTFAGATLAPGASCTFSVTLSVPAGAVPGLKTNTTSEVTATVGGVTAKGTKATDQLLVTGLRFSKAFSDDPVIAGGTATLSFTLDNTTGTADATGIGFTDNLAANLPGLAATLPPTPNPPCGGTLTGTTNLTFSGGSVTAGSSCTFSVPVTVPVGTPDDVYLNVTSNLGATIGGNAVSLPPATDTLTVDSTPLRIAKEFTDDPVKPGDSVTLRFTLRNLSTTDTVTDIAFDDDLAAARAGLVAASAPIDTCGGTLPGFPTGLFSYTAGTLLPGLSCMIELVLNVPTGALPGRIFPNTTTVVTGKVGVLNVSGNAASDDLEVDLLTFTKSFDGPSAADGTAVLTFTLTNLNTVTSVAGLAFSDDLDAALSGLTATLPPTPNPPCGAGSSLAGSSFLTLTGASLAAAGSPGDSCNFAMTVNVPAAAAAGTFVNTTSGLFQSGLPVAAPATALLTIEPPPLFAKSFVPGSIAEGGTSTLTFTIDNTASAVAASNLAFSDTLPAGVVVAAAPNASTTCTGGTVTAAAGGGVVSYSGGTVAAGVSCTVKADVTSATVGSYVNTSGALASSNGTSPAATATLAVTALPPAFSKAFAPGSIAEGGVSTLTFTIDNTARSSAASALAFSDTLPAGVVVAAAPNASTTCTGGTVTAAAGGGVVSYSGGTVAAGVSCTVKADVTSATVGSYVNTSGALASSNGTSPAATATLAVTALPPAFSKAFAPGSIAEGGVSTLTFTIDNTARSSAASALAFSDTLPAGVVVAAAPNASTTCTGGTVTAAAGGGVVSYSGGTVAAGVSCTVKADVTSATVGSYVNTSGALASSNGTSPAATATLAVTALPPAFSKAFAPGSIAEGGVSTLTFTIDNTARSSAASALAFSDTLPAGVVVAAAPNASTTCTGGTVTAAAGGGVVSYSGGTVAAGVSCTVKADVTSATVGSYVNTSGALASSNGTSPAATATLAVTALPPAFSKAFAPGSIAEGGVSTLTFTIDNTARSSAASALAFSDTLPAGVVVAAAPNASTTCTGGTVTAAAGGGVVSYSGGTVAAGVSCTVKADVTSATVGSYVNTSGALASSNGTSPAATATLAVTALPPAFSKAFAPGSIPEKGVSTLTFTIDNTARGTAVTDLAFLDTLPFDLSVAADPAASNTCGGAVVAPAGSVSISLSGGTVAAGASCALSIRVTGPSPGVFVNTTGDLTSSSGNSGTASDTLTVKKCPAVNGVDLTLENEVVLVPETYEVCRKIEVKSHYLVLGPSGVLTLRAGVEVILFNGVEFGAGSEVSIAIDPSLIP